MEALSVLGGCCGLPFLLFVLLCFAHKFAVWYEELRDWFARKRYSVYYGIEEHMAWAWGEKPPVRNYQAWRLGHSPKEAAVLEQYISLVQEMIRLRYLRQIVRLEPVTEAVFNQKMIALRKLETMHPRIKKGYSPTQYTMHSEHFAIEAFGYHEWLILKRTFDLLRADKVYHGEPD